MASLESYCFKIKLKPGSREQAREWTSKFGNNAETVAQLGLQEGVYSLSGFLELSEEADYLYLFFRVDNVDRAIHLMRESDHTLNLEFREFMRDYSEKLAHVQRE